MLRYLSLLTRVWALFLANIPHWSTVYAAPARPFNQPIVPDALMCVRIPPILTRQLLRLPKLANRIPQSGFGSDAII